MSKPRKKAAAPEALPDGELARRIIALGDVQSSAELKARLAPIAESVDALEARLSAPVGGLDEYPSDALASQVTELEATLRELDSCRVTAECLVLSHEGRIAKLDLVVAEVVDALRRGGMLAADETPSIDALLSILKGMRPTSPATEGTEQ